MTEPTNAAQTTEVSVETPAKITTTTEVASGPETVGVDADTGPDAATQAMEAEPKEG